MIGLNDVRDRLEPLLEVGDLLERISELHDGSGLEDPIGVHDEGSVLEGVEVRGDEEEIRARLDGEEPRSRDVDSFGVSEVLDGGSDGGLELNDGLAVVGDLVVDAGEKEGGREGEFGSCEGDASNERGGGGGRRYEHDLEGKLLLLHDSLDSLDINPH